MSEDEVIHLVFRRIFLSELVQRLFFALEGIIDIMRKPVALGPVVSETECNPRMEHAEEHLQQAAMEDGTEEPVSERHRTQAVTVTYAETLA